MIRNNILDKFKSRSALNIWYEECSTGEEVYIMLLTLNELNMLDIPEK